LANKIKELQMYLKYLPNFCVDYKLYQKMQYLNHATEGELFKLSWKTQLSTLLDDSKDEQSEKPTDKKVRSFGACGSCEKIFSTNFGSTFGTTISAEYSEKARLLIKSSFDISEKSFSWKCDKQRDEVLYCADIQKNSLQTKFCTILNTTVEQAYNYLGDLKRIKGSVELSSKKNITPNLSIVRLNATFLHLFQCSSSLLRYQELLEDKGFAIIAYCSTQNADKKSSVNCELYSLYILHDLGEGKCSVTYIFLASGKVRWNFISKKVLKGVLEGRLQTIVKMKKYFEESGKSVI